MLKKGEYRVIQVLNISSSLGSQVEECPKVEKGGMHKCLTEMGSKQFILYLVDGVDFGQNSVIELLADLKTPLVYRSEYRILMRTPLIHEVEFIKKLRDQMQNARSSR